MMRMFLMICVLAVASLPARPQTGAPEPQVPAAAQNPPAQPPAPVPADAPVITIHGLCPVGQPQSDSCTTVLTRQQFEAMVTSINISNQYFTPAALKNLATGYVTVLALANAGEKEGVDKDPRFQELMRVARTRALADAYRRYLQEKYSHPSDEEIEAYYKENLNKFEETKIDRILIPRAHPKHPQENRAEFEKKARQTAEEIRERAAKGEDMASLQAEAYKTLAIDMQPPQTEILGIRKGTFLPNIEQEINALKPGEVTKVEMETSGFNIYKLRTRAAMPLERAKPQIASAISQKKFDESLKAATSNVHSDLNEQFFTSRTSSPPQTTRVPARMVTPGKPPMSVPPATPRVGPGGNAPAANPGAAQTAPPKQLN